MSVPTKKACGGRSGRGRRRAARSESKIEIEN
jgi:hypothetical protein